MFSSNIRSGVKENEFHYFADLTEPLKEGLNAKTPTKVTHYYNYFLPFVNLNDCSKDEETEEDEMIDISDNVKLDKFILGEIININE